MTKFYDHTDYPQNGSRGTAESMRAELQKIEQGFDQVELLKADKTEIPDTDDFQQKSNILTALAAMTLAANKLLLATGTESFSTIDISNFGKTFINIADAAAARTALGLVIGTNVQAQNALLASLAGLASAADKLPYFTGANASALTDLSTFGRSLIDDANAGAARTTLGIDLALYALLAGATFSGNVLVPDDAYNAATWNGNLQVPTKKAIRDKIEALSIPVTTSGNDPTLVKNDDVAVSSNWVNAVLALRGMRKLGTLNTTSGGSQVLSSLDLTKFTKLECYTKLLSSTTSAIFSVNGFDFTGSALVAAQSTDGMISINLDSGQYASIQNSSGGVNFGKSGASTITRSTTSLNFAVSAGAFDGVGSTIDVYGVI